YRSSTGGTSGSWRNLTSSINLGGNLDEMAIAPSNNNYIYLARGSKVWRTKNGQSSSPSWVEVSQFSGDVNFITVDPNNPERVAIATTGSRVYVSTNAGSSWSNIRGNLPNISAQCVVYDDTQSNGLYVGMQSGVYYTNDVLSQWVPFMENLPNVQTSELEIHYPSRKIRLATYGRGIWESDLYDGNTSDGVSAPSNLLAQVEEKDVQLSWKDNASDETSFSLERSNGGAYQVIATLQANRTSYIDTNLEEGTYTYRIRARRNSDFSNYSNAATATVEGEVTPPDVADDCIGCRVYATNSEETESADNGKQNAADGDEDTFWHTNWYDDETETHPHYIAIDLGRERDLVGFSYLARQTERTTGMVKDYELRGWNGSQWVQLSVGQLQKSRLKQSVDFNKFRTRYVNFRALSEVDGKRWATVAEFTARYLPDDNENQNARATQEEVPGATPPEVNLDELEGLKIFPIPFANELTIRGINFKKSVRSIKFIGVDGREFKIRFKTTNDGAVFDTSKLLKGMYVLHLEEAEQTRTLRVFKQ
ncbi:MAG: discoidin domain-containing protein, partial [Bacteroidota bacterium]